MFIYERTNYFFSDKTVSKVIHFVFHCITILADPFVTCAAYVKLKPNYSESQYFYFCNPKMSRSRGHLHFPIHRFLAILHLCPCKTCTPATCNCKSANNPKSKFKCGCTTPEESLKTVTLSSLSTSNQEAWVNKLSLSWVLWYHKTFECSHRAVQKHNIKHGRMSTHLFRR